MANFFDVGKQLQDAGNYLNQGLFSKGPQGAIEGGLAPIKALAEQGTAWGSSPAQTFGIGKANNAQALSGTALLAAMLFGGYGMYGAAGGGAGGTAAATQESAPWISQTVPVEASPATAGMETVPMGASSSAGQSAPIGGDASWLDTVNKYRRLMPNQSGGGNYGVQGGGGTQPQQMAKSDLAQRMAVLMGLAGTDNNPQPVYPQNGLNEFYGTRRY